LGSNFIEEGSSSAGSNSAAQELRAMKQTLCIKGVLHIANLAANEGRPALLLWAGQRASLANVDGTGRSALMIAASKNRPQTVRAAITFCDLDQQYGNFGTAIHMAAYSGAAAAVQELCACDADLEAINGSYWQTPLHVACSRNHAEVVRILLGAGADRTARDKDGATASTICRLMGSAEAAAAMAADPRGAMD
jgi:ankyrin repeat protein